MGLRKCKQTSSVHIEECGMVVIMVVCLWGNLSGYPLTW